MFLNSSQKPKTHAKAKVEGAKRGRPMTAEGQQKKEIAAKTGQSLRNVQRITSEELKRTSELAKPRRAVAPGDTGLREFDRYVSKILDCVLELERKIGKFQPERFAATTVTTDKLAKAGKFLSRTLQISINLTPGNLPVSFSCLTRQRPGSSRLKTGRGKPRTPSRMQRANWQA